MTTTTKAAPMKLEDLTPAARAAVEQKAIRGGWNGRALVKLFAELERWDNAAEVKKSRAKKVFVTGIVALVAGLILFFVLGAVAEMPLPGAACMLPPLAVFIVGVRMKKAAQAIDLPDELRVTLRPVLKQLSQDLHPEEKIKVRLNLAGFDESKPSSQRDLPPGRNRSLKLTTYDEHLCHLRMPLTDGSEAVIRLENTYHKLYRTYRGRSGKYKSKTKWKKLSTVTTVLIPANRVDWPADRASSMIERAIEKVSFPKKGAVTAARLDRCYKFKSASSPPENVPPAADVIRMLIRLAAMRPETSGGAR